MYYVLYQNLNATSKIYKKWFGRSVSLKTIDLDGLIAHMAKHHTAYSEGVIAGVLRDMVGCIKELILAGNNVKIDNLAIFSGSITNKSGTTKPTEWSPATNVECVKVKALGTGSMSRKQFKNDSSLEYAPTYVKPADSTSATGGGTT